MKKLAILLSALSFNTMAHTQTPSELNVFTTTNRANVVIDLGNIESSNRRFDIVTTDHKYAKLNIIGNIVLEPNQFKKLTINLRVDTSKKESIKYVCSVSKPLEKNTTVYTKICSKINVLYVGASL